MRQWRILVAVVAAAAVAMPESAEAVQRGGTVTYLAAGGVDYLDPAQTYYTFGYMVQFAVNRPLYGFRPGDATPVPDLAAGPPEISADRRTITVHLRPGVRYAPPVDREVRAADVEYAIERAFSARVPSGYATSYFSELEGAPRRPVRGIPEIPGVEATDDRTLVLRLTRPVAQRVAAALVMPITVPVPPEHAARHDARRPSTYDRRVAFTGPYMVTARDRGRRIELGRNPNWDPASDFRPAYLDGVVVEIDDDVRAAVRRTARGSRLMCCDSASPPGSREVLRERPSQVGRVPSGGTRWVAFNTRVKPFDRLAVRRAAIAGMNRRALRDTRRDPVEGPVATHFLPPGLPGFEESGGVGGFSDLDFLRRPGGSLALARRYLRRAGYRGGRYRGRKRLLMVGSKVLPSRRTARLAARQLLRLGFPIRLKLVPQDRLYAHWCGVRARRYAICANVGWFKDFEDPEAMLVPTFSGRAIPRFGNVNWSHLRVPRIDRAMDAAMLLPAGPDRNRAWAAINHDITAQAPGAPYSWEDSVQLSSADVEGAMNPYSTLWDLAFSGIR